MAQELDYAGGMDFGSLAAAAQAHIDAVDTPQETVVQPDLSVTDAVGDTDVKETLSETQATEQVAQEASTGKVLEVAEDALVRVKIDGQVTEVPYKEFKDSLQREAAWHKRQQAFAEGKRQLESTYAQQFAELERGAQALKIYEQQLAAALQQNATGQRQQPQAQEVLKDEIATLSEVRQEAERVGLTIEQKLAARDQQYNQQLFQVAQKLKQEIAVEQDGLKFTKGLQNVIGSKEFKALEAIPNLEQNIRYEVWQMNPTSIDDAIDKAETIARLWNSKLRTVHVAEQQKAEAQKAKAKLEPSDGSAPPPQKSSVKKSFLGKDGKLNHTALREAAMALLD